MKQLKWSYELERIGPDGNTIPRPFDEGSQIGAGYGIQIWEGGKGYTGIGLVHDEKDARLIVKAPDMYAAMKRALVESGCDGDLCSHYWHEEFRRILNEIGPL